MLPGLEFLAGVLSEGCDQVDVGTLLEKLPTRPSNIVESVAAPTVTFHGLAVRASASKGQCFVLVDRQWTAYWRRVARWSEGSAPDVVRQAKGNGAKCIVVAEAQLSSEVREAAEGANLLVVKSTLEFFYQAGRAIRLASGVRLTMVTGSVGKTTTKDMIAHALRSLGHLTFSTAKSQNVPVRVVSNVAAAEGYEYAVIEASHGTFKRFARASYSLSADVAVVTAISESHLASIGTLEDVAELKSGVFSDPPPGGVAVICLDVPYADLLVRRATLAGRQIVTYGESRDATIRLVSYDAEARRVTAQVGDTMLSYSLSIDGRHNAINSLAVIATLRAYGLSDWGKGVKSLHTLRPRAGRGERRKLQVGDSIRVDVIDEAFNANPASVAAALATLEAVPLSQPSRKIAVLGDILELGQEAERIHRSLAPVIRGANIDGVLLFGPEMHALHDELCRTETPHSYFADVDALVASFPTLLRDGDLLLAKASHRTGLGEWIRENTTETLE